MYSVEAPFASHVAFVATCHPIVTRFSTYAEGTIGCSRFFDMHSRYGVPIMETALLNHTLYIL